MPWRVFGFIGLLIAVTAFSALNLDHRSDVSLGFHTFDAVPVFLTGLVAFTLGAVLVVLLYLPRRRVALRDRPPATQLVDAPAAAAAPRSEDEVVAPEPSAEADKEESTEGVEEPAGRRGRGWFGVRRRKERQD